MWVRYSPGIYKCRDWIQKALTEKAIKKRIRGEGREGEKTCP